MFNTDRSLRHWWPMLAAVPLGALCGGGYALVAPASYQSSAYVMAVPQSGADSAAAVDFAQAYGRIIAQPEILLAAAARTGVPLSELTGRVEAVTSPDAPMIQITGTAGRARLAAQEANAVARSLVAFGNATTAQTGVKLLPFATAAAPAGPSSPSRSIDLAVGTAAGVLLGGLALMARQRGGPAAESDVENAVGTDAADAAVAAGGGAGSEGGGGAELPQPRPLADREDEPERGAARERPTAKARR
ncbi:lipopolysaccharide biosynthesis protein [Streptacidiphilus sp. PB12-B1b]|uniref:YveK family protein n=1 Tax=Streptacidiphilus sp. PB12-B1b TaxID=2705012 RepID=UPI0015FDF637|nr:lipopolysaccharide biosynthesis protein [Streptacidiphilus sp. PB12-B1b]QMU78529.1 lipopolysaccharide biosynthesis protein [Streptacidiphilus sp. PB12-B1b]